MVDQVALLRPVPPYDFELSARIFADGDESFRSYKDGTFSHVIRGSRGLALCRVSSTGSVDSPELRLSTQLHRGGRSGAGEMVGKVRTLLNLDLDLRPFYKMAAKDRVLSTLTHGLRGLKSPTTGTVFEALIDSIVEQQISLNVARTFELRLIKKYGETLRIGGSTYYAFPLPEALAETEPGDLRGLGLNTRKAEYVRDIAKAVASGDIDLEGLRNARNAEKVIQELTSLRGVGRWTAELVMIRGMARFEAVPADDLGVRRSISRLFFKGRPATADMVRDLANGWGNWRGLAAFYVIVADLYGMDLRQRGGSDGRESKRSK